MWSVFLSVCASFYSHLCVFISIFDTKLPRFNYSTITSTPLCVFHLYIIGAVCLKVAVGSTFAVQVIAIGYCT